MKSPVTTILPEMSMNSLRIGAGGQVRQETAAREGGLQVPRKHLAGGFSGLPVEDFWDFFYGS